MYNLTQYLNEARESISAAKYSLLLLDDPMKSYNAEKARATILKDIESLMDYLNIEKEEI